MGNVQGNRRTNMGAVHENPLNRGKRRARKSAKQIWTTCMKICQRDMTFVKIRQTDMGNVHENLPKRYEVLKIRQTSMGDLHENV